MDRPEQPFTPWDRESRPYPPPSRFQPPPPPTYHYPATEHPASRRDRNSLPQSVKVASIAMLYLAVISLLAVPLSFAGRDALAQQLLALDPALTLAEATAQATAALGFLAFLNLLGTALFALLGFLIRGPRPVVRYLALGLLALGLMGYARQLLTGAALASPVVGLINGVNAVVVVVAIVMLWRPDATAYFASKKRR